jgi:concanavalin A-like lectin/glucanase superfamily protein
MKPFRIAALLGLLGVFCLPADAYEYPSPLGDQTDVTEALWDMDTVTAVLDGNRQSLPVIADKNTANKWRRHDLVLYGPQIGESNHPPFKKSLVFDGSDDYAVTYSKWYKDRAGVVVELWIWINNTQKPGPVFVASADQAWRMYLTGEGTTLNFQVFDPKGGFAYVHAPIVKQTWQHIRAEFCENASNQGALSLEISNGAAPTATAAATAARNKMRVDNSRIYLGADTDQTGNFHGEIDDVRITSQNVPSVRARGIDMVESFFLDTNPMTANAGDLATWCLATLWLSTLPPADHPIVASSDVSLALSQLVSLTNSGLYEQIALTRPPDDSHDADVYWGLLSLVRILNHPDIFPKLTTGARASVEQILSNFVRERDIAVTEAESTEGAIWSVYKSMNHDWLQKATFLLTAQYNVRRGNTGAYADGLSAAEHYNRWVKHLKAKIQQMAARGIDPEFGSPGYVSITLNGLYAIRDLSDDPELRLQTEKFIHLLLADAAAESFHGVRGGSKTRSYKGSTSIDADSDYLGMWTHLLANDPVIMPWGLTDRHAVPAAMSDYRTPSVVTNLMVSPNKAVNNASRRPARGNHDDPVRANRNPFYHFKFPSDIRRATFGTPEYILGSFTLHDNVPYDYYSQLTRVDQWMGLITSGWRYSRAYFQVGANENSPSSYDGLSAIQWPGSNASRPGECAMLLKRARLSDQPGLYGWLSDDFRANMVGPDAGTNYWIFSRNADSKTYLGIKAFGASSPGAYSISYPKDEGGHGTNARIDFANPGTVIALEVAPSSAYSDFDSFCSTTKLNTMMSNSSRYSYVSSGGISLTMDGNGAGSTVNGQFYPGNIGKTYSGNYLSNGAYDSPVITVTDPANNPLILDFNHAGYAIDPDWVELKYDDFEDGMGNYSDDGTYCGIDSDPANAHQGNYRTGTAKSVNIESSGGTASFTLANPINLDAPGYTQVKIEFWYRPVSMETGESFSLKFNNGGTAWTPVASYVSASLPSSTRFVNGDFRYGSVVLNEAAFGSFAPNARIRFQCSGSGADDDVFIDQVKISARVR